MKIRFYGLLFLSSLLQVILPRQTAADSWINWTWRSRISFDGYTRNETLTNFPVFIKLGSHITNFTYTAFASPAGDDLRFFSVDGSQELDYEIEKWDTNGESAIWVRLPALSQPSDSIWACWGNSNALIAPAYTTNGAVWTNGFEAVWHVAETTGAYTDASRHGYSATAMNTPLRGTNGVVGYAAAFNPASKEYLTCGAKPGSVISDPTGRDISFACWVRPNNASLNQYVFSSGGQTTSRGVSLLLDSAEKASVSVRTSTQIASHSSPALEIGAWSHLAFTYKTDTGLLKVYMNGTNCSSFMATPGVQSDAETSVMLGSPNSVDKYHFGGGIDEARFETAERSSNWVWASFLNQGSNDTFCAYQNAELSAETDTPSVSVSAASAIGPTQATLNGQIIGMAGAETAEAFFLLDTADRGANTTSDWARVFALGSAWGVGVPFSMVADGLERGATYTVRTYVTNSAGEAFSAFPVSFRTIGLPGITNLGPIEKRFTSVLLSGAITNLSGGSPPAVTMQWESGGPTSMMALGSQSGPFTNRLDGLPLGSAYTYRFLAENEAGVSTSAWLSFSLPVRSDWSKRLILRTTGYTPAESLADFPLLVKFSPALAGFFYADFKSPSPTDLRFTDMNGNELAFEIEVWNTNGESVIWVRLPTLSAGERVQALWGNLAAEEPLYSANGTVWSPTGAAVWHLQEASGTLADASRNGYSSVSTPNIVRGAEGLIGKAAQFNGTSSYINFGSHPEKVLSDPSLSPTLTFSTWLRPKLTSEFQFPFSTGGQSFSRGLSLRLDTTGLVQLAYRTATFEATNPINAFTIQTDVWSHVAAVYDFPSGSIATYLNGTLRGSALTNPAVHEDEFTAVLMGKPSNQDNYYYKGQIDETRVETTARSSNWIWACWFSQASNNAFTTYGAVNAFNAGILIIVL